ncbi:hypothetical protein EFP43_05720, partial [Lacticaseibacillus paracasei]|nr:hypothetical protein [Lacticaseibacillus paracasei]
MDQVEKLRRWLFPIGGGAYGFKLLKPINPKGSQHFFGQFAKRLFVKLGHTRKAMLLVQDSL